jgi:hypothetical protein
MFLIRAVAAAVTAAGSSAQEVRGCEHDAAVLDVIVVQGVVLLRWRRRRVQFDFLVTAMAPPMAMSRIVAGSGIAVGAGLLP